MEQNKEDFIAFVNDTLVSKKFTKEENKWVFETQVTQGGGVVVINGQQQQVPGEVHDVKYVVELYGDGEMKDLKSDIIDRFIEMNFYIEDGENTHDIGPTFCLLYDDQSLFNEIINKIFGL